jgi:ketosteroid isomerase-like protein
MRGLRPLAPRLRPPATKSLCQGHTKLGTGSSFTVKDDVRVHRRGRLAWATFTFGVDVVSKQGASSHLDGRWTLVLEERKRGWVVVHEHVSVPLGGS